MLMESTPSCGPVFVWRDPLFTQESNVQAVSVRKAGRSRDIFDLQIRRLQQLAGMRQPFPDDFLEDASRQPQGRLFGWPPLSTFWWLAFPFVFSACPAIFIQTKLEVLGLCTARASRKVGAQLASAWSSFLP